MSGVQGHPEMCDHLYQTLLEFSPSPYLAVMGIFYLFLTFCMFMVMSEVLLFWSKIISCGASMSNPSATRFSGREVWDNSLRVATGQTSDCLEQLHLSGLLRINH